MYDILANSFISLRFVVRTVIRGYTPFIPTTVVVGLMLLLVAIAFGSHHNKWAIIFLILLFVINFGSLLITETVSNVIIPALERIGAAIFILRFATNFILSFLRFDNATLTNPLGSPQAGEFVCWVANSPTFLFGLFVIPVLAAIVFALFRDGVAYGVLSAILFVIMYIPRRIFDCVSLCMAASELEGVYGKEDGGYGGAGYEQGGYEGGYSGHKYEESVRHPGEYVVLDNPSSVDHNINSHGASYYQRGYFNYVKDMASVQNLSHIAHKSKTQFLKSRVMNVDAWTVPSYFGRKK